MNEQLLIKRCPSIGCTNLVVGSRFCWQHRRIEQAVLPEYEKRTQQRARCEQAGEQCQALAPDENADVLIK